MPLEMVLGSKFPWKPGQLLPSSVSWLGLGWGTEGRAEAESSLGTGLDGWTLWKGHDIQWGAHRGTSTSSLSGLLMREDRGPIAAFRERDRIAMVWGKGCWVSLHPQPQTIDHSAAHPQFRYPT